MLSTDTENENKEDKANVPVSRLQALFVIR